MQLSVSHRRVRVVALPGLIGLSLLTGCATNRPPAAPESKAPISSATVPATPETSPPAPPAPQEWVVVDAPTPLTPEALWQRLQSPEEALYVVVLRHAIAPGTGDPDNFQLEDCATQRNLSDEGREQARQIGQAFRDRGVVVQQVLSSQWCRCLETAELMDLGAVEPYPPLNSFFRDRRTAEAQTIATQQFLLSQVNQSGVIVMVTHQVNITGLTEVVPRSGEAVVLQVEDDTLTHIGQFMPAS
jgi:phosphohistidine phosphatase SixA